MLEISAPLSFWVKMIWSRISAGVKSRTLPPRAEAQNTQPILHPTWLDTQTVFPCLYRIKTVSIQFPSKSRHRYFMVPSAWDTCFRSTVGTVKRHCSLSISRRDLGRSLISSKDSTPRWSQRNTCAARNLGRPSS